MCRELQKWGVLFCGLCLTAHTAMGESHSNESGDTSDTNSESSPADEKKNESLATSAIDGLFSEAQLKQIQRLRALGEKSSSSVRFTDKELQDVDDFLRNVAETGDLNEAQAKEIKSLLAIVEDQRKAKPARENLVAKEIRNNLTKTLDEKTKSIREKLDKLKQSILPYAENVGSANDAAPPLTTAIPAPAPSLIAMARDLHFSPARELASPGIPVSNPEPEPKASNAAPAVRQVQEATNRKAPSDSAPFPALTPTPNRREKTLSPGIGFAKPKPAPDPTASADPATNFVAPAKTDSVTSPEIFQLVATDLGSAPDAAIPESLPESVTGEGPYNPPAVSSPAPPTFSRDALSIPASDDSSSSEQMGKSDLEKVLARASGRVGYSARRTSARTVPTSKTPKTIPLSL